MPESQEQMAWLNEWAKEDNKLRLEVERELRKAEIRKELKDEARTKKM